MRRDRCEKYHKYIAAREDAWYSGMETQDYRSFAMDITWYDRTCEDFETGNQRKSALGDCVRQLFTTNSNISVFFYTFSHCMTVCGVRGREKKSCFPGPLCLAQPLF